MKKRNPPILQFLLAPSASSVGFLDLAGFSCRRATEASFGGQENGIRWIDMASGGGGGKDEDQL
jgi:hypothetical protein